MTAETPAEIAARLVDTIADIVSDAQYDGGGPDQYAQRIVSAIAADRDRQAAEIANLRSIIGDTVWCHACGSVVPLDKPECDCVLVDAADVQRLRAYDADAIAKIAELRAEIERLRADSWRPIAEAPKDGTKIVLAEYFDGGAYPDDARWTFWTDYWRQYHPLAGDRAGFGQPALPTHWQPLPPPPSTSAGEG